jgi:predicted protein tyrosine phosphatase
MDTTSDKTDSISEYSNSNDPSWVYDNLSWYLSWMWGKTRGHAQKYVNTRYSADCVYSEKEHGNDTESNFEIHLGGIPSLFNEEKLTENGITHILTAIIGVGKKYSKEKFSTLNIEARDVYWEKLCEHFDEAVDFIKECEDQNGKVFVHCMCGVSRSATLVAAYLIREKGMTADDAINHLHAYREKVNPNQGFRDQLKEYYKKCYEI